jgi:hypothetical protein
MKGIPQNGALGICTTRRRVMELRKYVLFASSREHEMKNFRLSTHLSVFVINETKKKRNQDFQKKRQSQIFTTGFALKRKDKEYQSFATGF